MHANGSEGGVRGRADPCFLTVGAGDKPRRPARAPECKRRGGDACRGMWCFQRNGLELREHQEPSEGQRLLRLPHSHVHVQEALDHG